VRVRVRVVDGHRERQLLLALALVGARDVVGDVALVVVDAPPGWLHAASDFIIASRALLDGVDLPSARGGAHSSS
jgi:hypothetical protein